VNRSSNFCHVALEGEQGIIQRGMNVENRKQIGELEYFSNPRIGASQFQRASTGSNPHVHNHQLAKTGAIDNLQSAEVNYDLTCLGQKFPDSLGESSSFIAIGKAASTVKNRDIIDCAGLQI
jgi:hypothetical protein